MPRRDFSSPENSSDSLSRVSASVGSSNLASGPTNGIFTHNAPHSPSCVICGKKLNVHEQATGKTCSRYACKSRHASDEALKDVRRKQGLQQRLESIRNELQERGTLPAESPRATATLPSNDRSLTGLSKQRRRRFVDRLTRVISQAASIHFGNAEREDDGDGYGNSDEQLSPSQLALLGNACASCQGHCCSQGDRHAFIHVGTIMQYFERHPAARPHDALQDYVSRIPFRSYQDSCVYHTDRGCALPRDMRSAVCNGYFCEGISQLLHSLSIHHESSAFVIAVGDFYRSEQGQPDRTYARPAMITSDGVTLYSIAPPGTNATQENCSDAT